MVPLLDHRTLLEDWHPEEGFGTEGSEGPQSIDLDRRRGLFGCGPIRHAIGQCTSTRFQQRSGGISAVVLTFQTAVPFLADASCLAAPAPAFVAIALANAEDEAL